MLRMLFCIKKKKQSPLFHLLPATLAGSCVFCSAFAAYCLLVEALPQSVVSVSLRFLLALEPRYKAPLQIDIGLPPAAYPQ
jgi:hypothetical protein